MPTPDQLTTVVHQIQNTVEVIIASHKQLHESWKDTLDVLDRLVSLLQRCGATGYLETELQQPLSALQSNLETTRAECLRYSIKKKGIFRVSAILPRWMVGKHVEHDFIRLRERIRAIYSDFEAVVERHEKEHDQKSNAAGPSSSSRPPAKRAVSPPYIEERTGNSGKTSARGTIERRSERAHTREVSRPSRRTSKAAEELEEWGTVGPEDWATVLTEMRNNVQGRAGSPLGKIQNGKVDRHVAVSISKPSGPKGVYPSTHSNLTLELRRLEIRLLMRIASFTSPDLCPPHDHFQGVKPIESYPVVISGYSWDVAVRHAVDLFYSLDASSMEKGDPETANRLFDLSQTLEDLCMHKYSYTVATWALRVRRSLYHHDKEMHRRDLAAILSLQARVLVELGRSDSAMIAAHGAVQLCYEEQALQGVQLAKALHVQASLLNASGKKSEAKAVAMEVVNILSALGEDKPHLKHFLALARASLSYLLVNMEEYREALDVAQAAIKSARALIGVVDSRPALIITLLIKARALTALGERGSAYVAGVEAVRHLRDLTPERPTFKTFLAYALVLTSRYLQVVGFYWEARKRAEEAVELYRTLYTAAPQAFAPHYAEALGFLTQLRTVDEHIEPESFDMAQHAVSLFREASIRDSDTLAAVLVVIATNLFEAKRLQEAAAPAEEAVGILRGGWSQNPNQYAPAFVMALRLASSCLLGTERALGFAKEAVQVHRERKDLKRTTHEQLLTHLLMDVFSCLRELGREAEAIPWKTEAAKLNMDLVENADRPDLKWDAVHSKVPPGGIMEYGPGYDDGAEDA
ncbi:hypothetical protein B0F90DRAFT_1681625 [Multifurca ochricompacta]|uniref:Uncharacterized protein n=1 Tax=Multifurca ochricompacta TaxID=376703 RepID=A0AAD4QU97_9AGAM|nr:hypothetical protein B0F90DRAFT_1681625 [Multifurca ochricompacta]